MPVQNNFFDYGVRFHTDNLVLYGFSDDQRRAKKFRKGVVHLMCKSSEFGSLDFRLIADPRIKLYQELCHKILFVIQKHTLDHIPNTMHSRLRQL